MTKAEYRGYLKSEHWQNLRAEKLKRSSGLCAICGASQKIDVHHLNYRKILDVETSDLRLLCRRCHDLAHALIRDGRLIYKGMSHHSRFQTTCNAVKHALGLATWQSARHYGPYPIPSSPSESTQRKEVTS